jgi:hypothetical protein
MQGSGRISLTLRNVEDNGAEPLRQPYSKRGFLGQSQTNEKCGDARRAGLMYIQKADGTREAMVLNENGDGFIPFSTICPEKNEKARPEL